MRASVAVASQEEVVRVSVAAAALGVAVLGVVTAKVAAAAKARVAAAVSRIDSGHPSRRRTHSWRCHNP